VKETEGESEKKERRRLSGTIKPAVKQAPNSDWISFYFRSHQPLSLCLPSLPSPQQSGFGEIKAQIDFAPSFWGLDQGLESMREGSTRLQTFPQTHWRCSEWNILHTLIKRKKKLLLPHFFKHQGYWIIQGYNKTKAADLVLNWVSKYDFCPQSRYRKSPCLRMFKQT